jgi:hypothetical protein
VFRLRQEAANLRLWAWPALAPAAEPSPLAGLPDPVSVAGPLRNTSFAAEVERLADQILRHEFPLLGLQVETGLEIRWRRDYRSRSESGVSYFRLIPYLDFPRVGDHKLIWELNRHQHLVLLAQAFHLCGREEYLGEIEAQLESWAQANPYMRGINWASALEVAFRALSWIWVYHLAGERIAPLARRRLLDGLRQHALYLEHNLSLYFSPNTHLLGEAVALHAVGRLFRRFPEAARWQRLGADLVNRQMSSQVLEDGSHFERSAYYHVYALDMFLFHRVLAETTAEFDRKLRRMAQYLAALAGSARTLPALGDDDGGRLFHPYGRRDRFARATLATCALLLNDPELPYEQEDLSEQAVWWLGPAVLTPRGRPAAVRPRSQWFSQAGVAVMEAEDLHVVARAGPFGPGSAGHSHSDCLSVVVRRGPEEILTDAGTYTYVAEPSWRDWFRGSAAHNTLRIDGRNQAVPAGPFRWLEKPSVSVHSWTVTREFDSLDASCSYAGFTHRRRLFLVRPHLLFVCDWVEGPDGEHLLEQFWHFGEPVLALSTCRFRIGSQTQMVLPAQSAAELSEGGEHGWRSPAFGQKRAAPVLRVHRQTALPAGFWSVLDFRCEDRPAVLRTDVETEGAACAYWDGVRKTRLRLDPPGVSVS